MLAKLFCMNIYNRVINSIYTIELLTLLNINKSGDGNYFLLHKMSSEIGEGDNVNGYK